MDELKKQRSDAGKKRVDGLLQTYTVSLNTVRDASIIEFIESGDKSRSVKIRELLHLGVKKVKK